MKHLFELEIGNAEYYACSGSEEHRRKSEVTVRQCEEEEGGKFGEEQLKSCSSVKCSGISYIGVRCSSVKCSGFFISALLMRSRRLRQIYGVFRAAFRCGRIFLQPRFNITGIDSVQPIRSIEPVQ